MSSRNNSRVSLPAVSIAAAWAVIAALLVIFAVHVWPNGTQDSQCILPPALEYRSSGELVHPFWQKAKTMDPTGEGRLIYHGFLLQLIVGTLALSPGYPSAHLVVMLILVAALGLFALAVIRVMRHFVGVPALYRVLLGVFAVAGLTTALLGLSGRPEPLAMLIVTAGFYAMTWLRLPRYWIPAGIALGLLGVTSPLPATIGFLLFAMYMHARLGRRDALVSAVEAGGVAALLAFSITHFWYPYPVVDWITGLTTHWATLTNVLKDFIHYWFTYPRNSFYGLLFLLALVLGLFRLGHRRRPIRSKAGFAVCAAALALIAVEFHLYSPGINYNFLVFAPLVYLAVIYICLEISRDLLSDRGTRGLRLVLHLFVLGIFLLTSLGFARTLVTFPRFLRNGVSYAEAKARLEDLRRGASGSILITPALFGLVDGYDGVFVMAMPSHAVPKTHEIVVFAQVGLARQTPPRIDGYTLVEDRFDHDAPRFFGITVANSSHGYDYAVYRRAPLALRSPHSSSLPSPSPRRENHE